MDLPILYAFCLKFASLYTAYSVLGKGRRDVCVPETQTARRVLVSNEIHIDSRLPAEPAICQCSQETKYARGIVSPDQRLLMGRKELAMHAYVVQRLIAARGAGGGSRAVKSLRARRRFQWDAYASVIL